MKWMGGTSHQVIVTLTKLQEPHIIVFIGVVVTGSRSGRRSGRGSGRRCGRAVHERVTGEGRLCRMDGHMITNAKVTNRVHQFFHTFRHFHIFFTKFSLQMDY